MHRRIFLATTLATPVLGISAPNTITPTKPFMVKAGEGRFGEKTKLFGTSPNDIKVSAKDTNSTLSVFEYNGHEKGGPPMHIHPHQDEIFYILDGKYLFEVGGEKHNLTVGETIFLPRNVPHTFAQLTDSGRMLFFLQPAGQMENYFRAIGKLTAKASPEQGAKIFTDHDMQVVGPPLTID